LAGPGAVNWDFAKQTLDIFLRNNTSGAFAVYNISANNLTSSNSLGAVGLEWQVAGFGYFVRSDFGQADIMMRSESGGNATYRIYDTEQNQFVSSQNLGVVGSNWKVTGFGEYATSDPNNFAGLMVLRTDVDNGPNNPAGTMLAYAIRNNTVVSVSNLGAVGMNWEVVGLGNFSSQVPLGMMVRNSDTNEFRIYDINQDPTTGKYSAVFANVLIPGGDVGLNWKVADFGPISGLSLISPVERTPEDMVLRNPATGAFQVYDIKDNTLTGSAPLTGIDTMPTSGGIAPDFSSQLVQAMAGFGGGAADTSNPIPLGADTSQQPLLTTPQHV
jgi:hypothetical protein